MAAPLGNTNGALGREFSKRWIAFAKQYPDRVDGLIEQAFQIAEGTIPCTMRDRLSAMSMVFDRICGKPVQAISGDEDAPLYLVQRVQREIVRAQPENSDG